MEAMPLDSTPYDNALPAASPAKPATDAGDNTRAALPFQRLQRDADDKGGSSGIYEVIIDQIKSLLRERHYAPGDKLPSERELSEQLGVNRNAIREAIRALTLMGVIQTRPQSGSQLSTNLEGMLRLPFEFLMLMLRPSYDELQELRELIEVYAAGRAAERRTDDDIARIEAALEGIRVGNEPENIGTHRGAPNRHFHRTVAAATQNRLLEYVLFCLLEARSDYIRGVVPSGTGRPERLQEHIDMLEAIRAGDAEAARAAMRADMRVARNVGQRLQNLSAVPKV